MPNTSATGGFLVPGASPAPLEDDALDDLFQTLIAGLTGLPGDLVRPRWQVKPPKQPAPSVDWCAVGVTRQERDAGPVITHDPLASGGLGQDKVKRHEELGVLVSFYGPNAGKYAGLVADGAGILQNNELLQSNLVVFVNSDTIRQVPELVAEQWVKRRDLPLRFRREVVRVYPILNIVSATAEIVLP